MDFRPEILVFRKKPRTEFSVCGFFMGVFHNSNFLCEILCSTPTGSELAVRW